MKSSWIKTFRRLAAAATVVGTTTFASAMCYAQSAYDDASDPAYADGWQAGDNGGYGFTPWNFDAGYIFSGTNFVYGAAGFKAIDDGLQNGTQLSNPFNAIGQAWTIGTTPNDDGAPHVGRGFSPLQKNQTLRIVFDNPTKRQFFKGYFIRVNGGSGGTNGNICNLGYGCSHPSFPDGYPVGEMNLSRFEYFNFGEWNLYDDGSTGTGVFDTDTSAAGALFQVKKTGASTYDFLLDSFGGGPDYSASRTFDNPASPIDWIEFVFFNPASDTGAPPTMATDLYIRSMTIVPEPATIGLLVLGVGTLLGVGGRRRRD